MADASGTVGKRKKKIRNKTKSVIRAREAANSSMSNGNAHNGQSNGSRRKGFNTAELVIPRNEQDRMMKTVNVGNAMISEYLAALVHPKMNISRVPDSYYRPTALAKSITSYDIPIRMVYPNPGDSANVGRFSILAQPYLGTTSSPSKYKLAIAYPNQTVPVWGTADWSLPDNYLGSLMGTDVRLDQFYLQLTQPPLGTYMATNNVSTNIADFLFSCVDPIAIISNYNAQGVVYVGTTGVDTFRVPVGQYVLTVIAFDSVAVIPAAPTMVNGNVDQILDAGYGSTDTTTFSATYYVTAYADGAFLTLGWRHTGVVDNSMWVSFTPTYYSNSTLNRGFITPAITSVPSENYGVASAIRTVGMSVLATYTGPVLTNGGNIAAAYVPGGASVASYFTSNPVATQGSFQNWENLAKVPGSYNGEINQGAYCFWTPEDQEDLEFTKPGETSSSEHIPPCLIISGQYNPGQTLTSDQLVIRLEVVTLYEFVTTSQLFGLKTCVGSQAFIDRANLALSEQPHAMANAAHMQWLKDFWGGLKKGLGYWEAPAKFLWNNRDKVGAALGALA